MPRNNLKRFPTAFVRRGLAHFHPGTQGTGQAPSADWASTTADDGFRLARIPDPLSAPATPDEEKQAA